MDFKFFQISPQNPKGHSILPKNSSLRQNLTETLDFLGHEAQIIDQLYIMAPYKSFYEF
jgi:hypothetical protein